MNNLESKIIEDSEWGCSHSKFTHENEKINIHACFVTVNELCVIAEKLASSVLDTSWILALDKGTQRSYDKTAKETAIALANICKNIVNDSNLSSEFGEIMVSIGSSRALEIIFQHNSLPIAELWKPQIKQNEGFDFHTNCKKNLINFGEAKYSSSSNPHSKAINQAKDFIEADKHYRDRVHLINFFNGTSIENLDNELFGVIAAFSVNTESPDSVMDYAIKHVIHSTLLSKAQNVYLVGVICKE